MVASSPIPIILVPTLARPLRLRIGRGAAGFGRQRELGSDLVKRVLGVRKAKLMAEKRSFRRSAIRTGAERIEGWINEGLGFLNERGESEHDV